MHVLFVPFNYQNPYQPIAALFFHDQAQALRQAGFKVTILSAVAVSPSLWLRKLAKFQRTDLGYRHWQDMGLDVYQYLFPAVPKSPQLTQKLRVNAQRRLYRKLRQAHGAPDITHVQMFPGGDFAQWLQAREGTPYVVTEHLSGFAENRYSPWQLNNARACFANSSARISVSNHLADTLQTQLQQSFEVIPNCVDTQLFSSTRASSHSLSLSLNLDSRQIRKFIHVGRLDPIKNQVMMVRAFMAADLPPDSHLTIVGAGEEQQNLHNVIAELNAHERVTLYGAADKATVVALLDSHDAFVLASRYETFGVVLIEAMSMGLPVLATGCLGAKEIVTDAKVGTVVQCNQQALSLGFEALLQQTFDPDYIRQFVDTRFSNQALVTRLQRIYSDVLQ